MVFNLKVIDRVFEGSLKLFLGSFKEVSTLFQEKLKGALRDL